MSSGPEADRRRLPTVPGGADPLADARQQILTLLGAGRAPEAVTGAARLVEALRDPGPAELADAMGLLARAFEADGDPDAAGAVIRSLAGRLADAEGPEATAARLGTAALAARYQRLAGTPAEAAHQLSALLDRAGPGIPESPRSLVLAELVETRLALGDLDAALGAGRRLSELATGPGPHRPAALAALDQLIAELDGAGRGAQAIPLQQAAIELLGDDTSVAGRRRRTALWIGLAQGLTLLGRADVVRRIGERCFGAYHADPDRETRQNALVAGCLGAQAALALGEAEDALELAERIAADIPDADPQTPELQGRVGLVVAAAQLELDGPEVAEATYRRVVRALRSSPDPGTRLFLALALEMVSAMPGEIERLGDVATAARELAGVIRDFPPEHPDFPAVAECGNRAAERLIPFGAPRAAAELTDAITRQRHELIGGPDEAVCLRAYIFRLDALRIVGDGPGLEAAWQEVLELGDPALEILDGLGARYRQDGLRAALAYTELGRVAVLARLGREEDARRTVERIFAEFGADEDREVQSILSRLRPQRPE